METEKKKTTTTTKQTHSMHIVMFPWFAMGHFIPFLRLSMLLARRGHTISFLSTPNNLSKLPRIAPDLSPHITLVPLPFPEIPELPPRAESSFDVLDRRQPLLKLAFDSLLPSLRSFLEASSPDWIVYDYASHWVPALADELRIPCAFLSLFNSAVLCFLGSPSDLIGGNRFRPEDDLTVVPPWIPFKSDLAFLAHEVAKHAERSVDGVETTHDLVRFGVSIRDSDAVVIRTCVEFEPEWFGLLRGLFQKPVLPVGFLPPDTEEEEEDADVENEEKWGVIKDWLDKQSPNSVVYAAFGTEATPSEDELAELALGLEKSGLPFFWALRNSPESTRDERESLPSGFLERTEDRGFVYTGWAPQVKILSHDSVGGFLTHCGCNSVIEALACGRVLVLFPIMNEQGLNSRLLRAKGVGVEVPRNEGDGSFTSDLVAESLRLAMVDESGKSVRSKAREMKGLFGNKEKNNEYVDEFVRYLQENGKAKFVS